MNGDQLLRALLSAGIRWASGVPCSYYGDFFGCVDAQRELSYVPAAHEGLAVSLAAGVALSGEVPCVLMQNSGLGNAINPLTSLIVPYRLPLVLLVSGRAWKVADEPQHRQMGEQLETFLTASGARLEVCPPDPEGLTALLQKAAATARSEGVPVAIIVPKGTFEAKPLPVAASARPSRQEVISQLVPMLSDQVVVATTGFTSRDLYALADRPRNFYMQGSMGHALSVGLGVALRGQPVVVLDGDGAALMHPGAMAMVGQFPDAPVLHLILDNGAYESTGNQPVAARPVDLAAVARAVGYRHVRRVDAPAELPAALEDALRRPGTRCLVIATRIEKNAAPGPRISTGIQHHEIAQRVRESLRPQRSDVPGGRGDR